MKKCVGLLIGLITLAGLFASDVQAQGIYSLSTTNGNTIAGTSYYGPSFTLTALKSTKLYRFWMNFSTGTANVAIWAHPNTVTYANDGQWICLGTTTMTITSTAWTEIPIDLNFLMNAGETWGFIVFYNGGGPTPRYTSSSSPTVYADSYLSMNTAFTLVTASSPQTAPPSAFTFTWGLRKFCGKVAYDEGCYFPAGMHSLSVTDASGAPLTYANIPGSVYAKLHVAYPAGNATITSTLNFYRLGGSTTVPEYVYTFTSQKVAGQDLDVMQQVPISSNLLPGFYRIVPVMNAPNSCGQLKDMTLPETSIMLIYPGTTFCVVWPGDCNNDGIVNYGDRKTLNKYIYDANLRSSWLSGPGRYRADAAKNPMAYYSWEGQAGIPWNTTDGCYMDTDGNGAVNNFDYVGIKLNWMKAHGSPRNEPGSEALTFNLAQNHPNPFNPSTTLSYSVPEPSNVRLTVSDFSGRTIATLVDGKVEAGSHELRFDASNLPSGHYVAFVTMAGIESGLTYSKTIKMTLSK
jgi:hypothetical protein